MNEYKKKIMDKFEYIDFNEDIINEAFERAYISCREANGDNEIAMKVSIADYFINELIPIIENDREDILIAIQFAYEKELEFFMRKRNIKTRDSHLTKAYEIAVSKSIIEKDRLSFTSVMINNLITLLKQKEEDMIKMEYNIKEKNIYEIFNNYDESMVSMILETMKKREERSYFKFINIFGDDFKHSSSQSLTYYQNIEIQNKLKWFEKKLQLTKKLMLRGKTLANVKELLLKQSDTKLIEMMAEEDEESKTHVFASKKDLLNYYNISKKELDDALGFLENKDAITIFKYTYGIGVQSLTKSEIITKYQLTDSKYNEFIEYVYENLEKAIREYREYMNSFKLHKSESERKETINKKQEKNENKKSFFRGLFEEGLSEEQEQKYKEIIIANVHASNSEVAKNIIALYGENLESYNENIELNKNEIQNIRCYKTAIRKKIKEGKLEIVERKKQTNKLSTKKDKTFFAGLFEESLSEEQEQKYKEIIIANVHASNSEVAKNIIALYGKNLESYNENIELNKNEIQNIRCYKTAIRKKIKEGKLEIVERKKQTNKLSTKKDKTFFAGLFEESLSEEQEQKYKEIIIANVHASNSEVAKNIIALYGKNLESYNENIELNKNEIQNIRCYKTAIRKKIKEGSLVKKEKTQKKYESQNKVFEKNKYFIYRIASNNESSEELEEITSKLYEVLPEFKEYLGYKIAQKLYGPNLEDVFTRIKLSQTERSQFYFFINSLKRRIEKMDVKIKDEVTQTNNEDVEYTTEIKEASISPEKIIKEDSVNPKEIAKEEKETIKLNYIEELIYNLYSINEYEPRFISQVLNISIDEVITVLIKLYQLIPNKNSIVEYIAINHPNKIKELLNNNYIKKGLANCSNAEMKVIYMKLLSRSNPMITDEFIANITGLNVEDVINYQLMTKEDNINELAQLIMRKKKTNEN